jgi:hypothetical protein
LHINPVIVVDHPIIIIYLHQPELFIENEKNWLIKKTLQYNFKKFDTPFIISPLSNDYDPLLLLEKIKTGLQQWQTQNINIQKINVG